MRQCALDNHILDLVVVCMLSLLHMSLLRVALSLLGYVWSLFRFVLRPGQVTWVPSSQIYSTLSHSLEPIIVTYCIQWTVVMTNLDSHMSELCCSLSLHVLDYALLHDVRIATHTTCRLFGPDDVQPHDNTY